MLPVLRFTLFGQPVKHSLSPLIHPRFAEQFGLDIEYTVQEVETQNLAKAVTTFFAQGGAGANFTVPHKNLAYTLAEHRCPMAERARAGNTMWQHEGKLHLANTDGLGLLRDIKHNLRINLGGNPKILKIH